MTCKPLSRLYFSNGIVASCPGAPIAARAAKEIVAAIATLHTCIAADASPPAVDSRGVCLIDDLCHAQQDGLMRIRMAAALLALSGCSFDSRSEERRVGEGCGARWWRSGGAVWRDARSGWL